MDSRKEITTSDNSPWRWQIQYLQLLLIDNAYHAMLGTLQNTINLIDKYHEEIESSDIEVMMSTIIYLDKLASEYHYRLFVLGIINILDNKLIIHQKNELLAILRKIVIKNKLRDPKFGATYPALCGLTDVLVENFFSDSTDTPRKPLFVLREKYINYLKYDLERYRELAFVHRIIGYWRFISLNFEGVYYAQSDIIFLLQIGEDLLRFSYDPERTESTVTDLKQSILLLQSLVCSHEIMEQIETSDWPENGFVRNMICEETLPIQESNPETTQPQPCKPFSSLFGNYKDVLDISRKPFRNADLDFFTAQSFHSETVIQLLKEMATIAANLLGKPPCSIGLCILGSTSRYDRRPYSDVEFVLFHSEPDENLMSIEEANTRTFKIEKWKKHVEIYIWHFFGLIELMIERVGEYEKNGNTGFHIDTSCNILTSIRNGLKFWGTPSEMAMRFIINPKAEENKHPWFDSIPLYSLLQPRLLHPGVLGGDDLLLEYNEIVKRYLNTPVSAENDNVTLIIQRFNLPKKSKAFCNLQRHEGIAATCLLDVLTKCIQHYQEFKRKLKDQTKPKLNIKDIFYKPLSYLALNIKLFYELDLDSPIQIIKWYITNNGWYYKKTGEWWSTALEFIYKIQSNLHMESGHQEEEIEYPPKSAEEHYIWAGLDLIFRGFVEPLYESVRTWFIKRDKSFLEHVHTTFTTYLNERYLWYSDWQEKGMSVLELLDHPLITPFASLPDTNAWTPFMEKTLFCHQQSLRTLVRKEKSHCRISGLPGKGVSFLPSELVNKCFDKRGNFRGDLQYSRKGSQVKKISWEEKEWFIRVKDGNLEELLAREYVAMIAHLLMGYPPQIALGWPFQLQYSKKDLTKVYYAWISEAVPGESMSKVMNTSSERLSAKNLDLVNYGLLFFWSNITCQEDGQPENFKVLRPVGAKTKLKALDYGQCLVQGTKAGSILGVNGQEILTQKTMINILDAIDEPIPQELIQRLLLINANGWFHQLTKAVSYFNDIFKPILAHEQKESSLVNFNNELLICLRFRFEVHQYYLKKKVKSITFNDVLKGVDPLVASLYQSVRPMIKTPEDFYRRLDIRAYVIDKGSSRMVSSASVRSIKAQTLTASRLHRSMQIPPHFFESIDFKMLTDEEQDFILTLIEESTKTNPRGFRRLDFSGCRIINKTRLIKILSPLTMLNELDISDCQKLNMNRILFILAPISKLSPNSRPILVPGLRRIILSLNGKIETLPLPTDNLKRLQLAKHVKNLLTITQKIRRGLLKATTHYNTSIQTAALEGLGNLSRWNDKVEDALLKGLESRNSQVSMSAAKGLRSAGRWNERIKAALLTGSKYSALSVAKSAVVRKEVLKTVTKIGRLDDDIYECLLESLCHPILDIPIYAKHTIETFGLELRVLDALIAMCKDKNPNVRKNAIKAIGILGIWNDKSRICILKALDNQDEEQVFSEAILVLSSLCVSFNSTVDKELESALLNAFYSLDEEVKIFTTLPLLALGYWDEDLHAAALSTLIDSEIEHLPQAAINVLGTVKTTHTSFFDDNTKFKLIRIAKNHNDEEIRLSTLALLCDVYLLPFVDYGRLDDDVIMALLQALGDPSDKIRSKVLETFVEHKNIWNEIVEEMLFTQIFEQQNKSTKEELLLFVKNANWGNEYFLQVIVKKINTLIEWENFEDLVNLLFELIHNHSEEFFDHFDQSENWNLEIQDQLISMSAFFENDHVKALLYICNNISWISEEDKQNLPTTKAIFHALYASEILKKLQYIAIWSESLKTLIITGLVDEYNPTVNQACITLALCIQRFPVYDDDLVSSLLDIVKIEDVTEDKCINALIALVLMLTKSNKYRLKDNMVNFSELHSLSYSCLGSSFNRIPLCLASRIYDHFKLDSSKAQEKGISIDELHKVIKHPNSEKNENSRESITKPLGHETWSEELHEKLISALSRSKQSIEKYKLIKALANYDYADPRIYTAMNSKWWFEDWNRFTPLVQCYQPSALFKYLRHQISKLICAPTNLFQHSNSSEHLSSDSAEESFSQTEESQLEKEELRYE